MKTVILSKEYFEGLDNIKILTDRTVEYKLIKFDAKLQSLKEIADNDQLKEMYNDTLEELKDYCIEEMKRIGFTVKESYSGGQSSTYIYDERLGKELYHPNYQSMYIHWYARLYWSQPEKYPLEWTRYMISDYIAIPFMFQLYNIRHEIDMGFYNK